MAYRHSTRKFGRVSSRINFYNRSHSSPNNSQRGDRDVTVKHAALPGRGRRGWKCSGLPTFRVHRAGSGGKLKRFCGYLNTARVALSYLGLRRGSLPPPAKCFSPETPDSVLRNLSPFFLTGDKVDVNIHNSAVWGNRAPNYSFSDQPRNFEFSSDRLG